MTRLAVGTSQLRSVRGGLPHQEAVRFISSCVDAGVLDFDTANIYGQGDAERVLGEVSRAHPQLNITTKAGLPMPSGAAGGLGAKIKPVLVAASRSRVASNIIGKVRNRQQGSASVLTASALAASLQGSLARLESASVARLMLHNPPHPTTDDGRAWKGFLQTALEHGDCVVAGVSHHDADLALAWAQQEGVTAVQMPGGLDYLDAVRTFRASSDATLVVRQVFSGGRIFDSAWRNETSPPRLGDSAPHLEYVAYLAAENLADEVLIGSTNTHHVREVLSVLEGH